MRGFHPSRTRGAGLGKPSLTLPARIGVSFRRREGLIESTRPFSYILRRSSLTTLLTWCIQNLMDSAPQPKPAVSGLRNAARIIVVSSVMFTFISYWRTAAVVLCDLGSTAYYIGGIVEQAIGPAAPWFILAVMVFSYAVRSVYIESCSLFMRGGVYRVVKEALGGFFAKLAVSALIFDYLLTGPISGVSAGHYLMGLVLDSLRIINDNLGDPGRRPAHQHQGVRRGLLRHCRHALLLSPQHSRHPRIERRALKIMVATTVMVVIILAWCGVTLAVKGIAYDEVTEEAKLDAKGARLERRRSRKPDCRCCRTCRKSPCSIRNGRAQDR